MKGRGLALKQLWVSQLIFVITFKFLIKKYCYGNSSFHKMSATLAAILAAILDFSKILFLAELQELFDWNWKYCLLDISAMCVDNFSVMFLL